MSTQSTPDQAYYDRNQTAMLAAKLALQLGLVVGTLSDPDEPGWTILYIDLPTGQVSWHIPDDELVGSFPNYPTTWDGHTVEDKRRRIIDFLLE